MKVEFKDLNYYFENLDSYKFYLAKNVNINKKVIIYILPNGDGIVFYENDEVEFCTIEWMDENLKIIEDVTDKVKITFEF